MTRKELSLVLLNESLLKYLINPNPSNKCKNQHLKLSERYLMTSQRYDETTTCSTCMPRYVYPFVDIIICYRL